MALDSGEERVLGVLDLGFYEAFRGARCPIVYRIQRPCPACGGSGREGDEPCEVCGGAGEAEQERITVLSVPAGVQDGNHVRVEGEDGAFVVVRVGPRPRDSKLVRAGAAIGLAAAVAFLAFLFLA
jgi:hypothetical protein